VIEEAQAKTVGDWRFREPLKRKTLPQENEEGRYDHMVAMHGVY
jgi:hypothetical protein